MKLLIALFFTVLLSNVEGAIFPCEFSFSNNESFCNLPISGISVTTENEEITVTGVSVPEYSADTIKTIMIPEGNILRYVPTRLFETFRNLEKIIIAGVQLTTMTTYAFKYCLQLKELQVRDSMFIDLPASFAGACVNLKTINLHRNNITKIDKDAFKGLTNLEQLLLGGNKFTTLDPLMLKHTPNLLFFEASGKNGPSELKTLDPELFAPLNKIEKIHLMMNKIEVLPALRFGSVAYLEEMDLSMNLIDAVDIQFFVNFFGDSNRQFHLRFEQNKCFSPTYDNVQLPPISPTDKEYKMLEPCIINWNRLTTTTTSATTLATPIAPDTTETTSSTTSLATTIVPDTCGSHRDCRYHLDFEKVYACVLENVDLILTSIGGLHQTYGTKTYADGDVKKVYFFNSILSKVPQVVFEKFVNVEFLSIKGTSLSALHDKSFQSCGANLLKIDASENFIATITDTAFKNCLKLDTIDLRTNPISKVRRGLFINTPSLETVILTVAP
jgi:hypothetical protein